ncbi:putative sodium-coupled neutral amino acid transporter 10 [Cimex lectularius]|uniref:Amino acid transporter transmembrane domain-containing protein n=1 Tax=Cimex lectularius TaxID=79782 RepID=A0A8I6TE58_CIMLE|nr:putative sodium-coupled neutral amino acid transporter 10 [Cimex lectularius]
MGSSANHVLTLANCIIGVSVLTMPFCFKQCGIALAILMLYLSSQITKLSCHYLLKSAIMEKMKNFEMLAFRAFGPTGKTMVELCIIGFMLGSCVAFFVIMGDLGPTIVGPVLGIEHVSALRPSVLIGIAVFVVLPLGLLRNVDSLSTICTASIVFYMFLVLKVFTEAASNLLAGNWLDKVSWWRPSGVLQCIPIFSMALSCQTQLFGIFDSLPNAQLERTNAVVRLAINMTTLFYIAVGFFGYTAYYNQSFSGNLMLSFSPSLFSQVMKMGFLLSIAVSFPLVIFPCRASIYSFLYSKIQHGYEGLSHSSHIPQTTFQCITLAIITLSLVIGLLLPDIEVVIGLVGSTIGVFVCLIIPGMIFNSLSSKKNNEKLIAQCLVGIGLIIMVLGTYANLFATEEKITKPVAEEEKLPAKPQPEVEFNKRVIEKVIDNIKIKNVEKKAPVKESKDPPAGLATIKESDEKVVKAPAPEPVQPEPPKEVKKPPDLPIKKEIHQINAEEKHEVEIKAEPAVQGVAKEKKEPDPIHPEPPEVIKEEKNVLVEEVEKKVNEEVEKKVSEEVQKKVEIEKKIKEVKIEGEENIKLVKMNLNASSINDKIESLKENITASMMNGVPIPLVAKSVEVRKDPQKTRNILKVDREKRDVEAEEKGGKEKCSKTEPPKEELIKAPQRLTGEVEVRLEKLKTPEARIEPVLPLKRDLKSVHAQANNTIDQSV